MSKQEEFAKRFATVVDAECCLYEKAKGKKASDYIRRRFRDKALEVLSAGFPNEVSAVRDFVEFLNDYARLNGRPGYPSMDKTPVDMRPGAEMYAIYRGVLSSKTRYRKGGMDAYRGPKNKTIIKRGEQPMPQTMQKPASDGRKRFVKILEAHPGTIPDFQTAAALLDESEDVVISWYDEWNRNHRLSKLIAALSPEDMEALTDLLSQK